MLTEGLMILKNIRLPNKIEHCPIVETIAEVRFDSSLPVEILLGNIFSELGQEYKSIENLPILDIPQVIRDNDPALKYNPYYKLIGNNFVLQLGPRSFSIVNTGEYVGWDVFNKKVNEAISALIVRQNQVAVLRTGLRYMSFF